MLDDDTLPILAVPAAISEWRGRGLLVSDVSDRNIKLYALDGRRIGTVGRAGQGPDEFGSLFSMETYHDSIAAYDLTRGLNIFSPAGRHARMVPVQRLAGHGVMFVRVVDDSLFLLVGTAMGNVARRLLTLVRPGGERVSTFFDQSHHFDGTAALAERVFVDADGRDGVVFAGLVGGDSIFAFDYSGRLLASAPVDPVRPLTTTKQLLARNRGRPRRPDGNWVTQDNRQVFRIIALDSATAVVYVAPYDARAGSDLVEGGTLIALGLSGGKLHHLARSEVPAGLFGRDERGSALLLGYADAEHEKVRVSRLRLVRGKEQAR
ncbi:MAG TPA: hypothetical protein VFQ45_05305 [Longimicrobium sp.]|nr:hypothetical protein [Longimicrobium sp.]